MQEKRIDGCHDYNGEQDGVQPFQYAVKQLALRMETLLTAHFPELFYRIDYSFECLRVVHGEVGENFAVETYVLLAQLTHKLRV